MRQSWIVALGFVCFASCCPAVVAATTSLPDTPVGRLAGDVIRHVNTGSAQGVSRWVPLVLSPAIDAADKAGFVEALVAAARESGGLDVFDVRTDPRQPGLLEVAVKSRRGGRRALLVLAADSSSPDKLATADLVSMGDPELYAGWPQGAVSRTELQRLVGTALDRLVRTEDFSGCVTVSDGTDVVFDQCRGLAERSFGVPVDDHTKFHVGSIDKMFTAVAIAQLVEAGKLSWNSTLAQLLPGYPGHAVAGKINVWELLHHTAGLGDFFVPEFFEHREKYTDPLDYMGLIARQPLVAPPGKQWHYSNAGYVLLGCIIEKASGESYFDYVRQHVFAPADMRASGFDTLAEVTPDLAVGYFRDGPFATTWKADWMKIPFRGGPAGGGYSTNGDLLRFASALRSGKLLAPATLATMFSHEVPAGPGAYAAGFGDRLSHGCHVRGHAGGIEGTTANLQVVWGTGAAVALTSNEGPSENWLFAEHIADLLAANADARGACRAPR